MLRADNLSGWLWIACLVSILALPPFPAFISELLMAKALLAGGHIWLTVLFFLLLTIIMYGLASSVLKMSFGDAPQDLKPGRTPLVNYLPQLLFLAILVVLGLAMPRFIYDLLDNAARAL